MAFENRRAAGRQLAEQLRASVQADAIVVGVTRGGMAVAQEVAAQLHLPLDALVIHKITEPGRPHTSLAVVAEPQHLVVNRGRMRALALTPDWLEEAVADATGAVSRRGATMRGQRDRHALAGRQVILVDDSAATGTTARAAVKAVRSLRPRKLIVALPVAPRAVVGRLKRQVDRVVCLATPGALIYGGVYYPHPGEVSDADIQDFLQGHARGGRERPHGGEVQAPARQHHPPVSAGAQQ
jgi:putative phosphoribosyl transferase